MNSAFRRYLLRRLGFAVLLVFTVSSASLLLARLAPPDDAFGTDPKILVAVLSWVIYSFALFARRAIGWAGRRAAYLSTIAFGVVLLNFVLVGYFLTKSHNF